MTACSSHGTALTLCLLRARLYRTIPPMTKKATTVRITRMATTISPYFPSIRQPRSPFRMQSFKTAIPFPIGESAQEPPEAEQPLPKFHESGNANSLTGRLLPSAREVMPATEERHGRHDASGGTVDETSVPAEAVRARRHLRRAPASTNRAAGRREIPVGRMVPI